MDSTILQPPGNYPDDWVRTDFDHFATLQRGKDLTRDHFRTGSVPVAGSNGVIGHHDTANVRAPGITVGRSGSVGKVTFYRQDFWAHNTALFVKDFHGNVPAFIAFFLDFLRLGRFGSGASVPTLDRNVFRTLPIVIPPPCEQRKIAAILELVRRAMEQQERLIALTTELKKALLHKLFTEGLRGEPQKQTEIGPVPESWEVVELGSLATKISKGSSPRWQGFEYVDHGVLFIRSQNVGNCRMDFSDRAFVPPQFNDKEKRSILKNEDVLINLVGASIGRVALGTEDVEGANCNQAVCFVRIDRPRSLKELIIYYLLSPSGQQQMFFQRKDIARANLSLLDVRSLKVPAPRADETEEVAEIFRELEQKLELSEKKKAAFTDLFRTLLHQLMTAQIRVKDLDLQDPHSLNED